MIDLVWLIPALPLAGFVVLVLFGKRMGEPIAGWFATMMVAASFLVACLVFAGLVSQHRDVHLQHLFTWVPAGSFSVDVGLYLDHLSITMVLFITGISALIHMYAIGYMHGDPGFSRFFIYLNVFVFSMLLLVLADNLLLAFVGWEGVGACSYLLISFWFDDDANASAGKKAFVTNRVGDWGFMVAMFATFVAFGSLNYSTILDHSVVSGVAATTLTFIAVMLFVGAIGKSAQIPLFIWLPDAMAGPTPVSALIHAATMVTAGVYLMCRVNPILGAADPWVSTTIAWVGVITALVAATIACAQMDIKKVLAYSTVSQLGFMFLAVGVHAYWAAVFHMVTHAFFKATMFLGSGSVIHGMHGEQDLRRMGRLRKYMPVTAYTFIFGWLAIAGIPPFSGFWSKDEILAYALDNNIALYGVGLATALLTAYYMSRLVFRTFEGSENWRTVPAPADGETIASTVAALPEDEQMSIRVDVTDAILAFEPEPPHSQIGIDGEPHESPATMTFPLVVLAGLSLFGGLFSLPFGGLRFFEHWLEPVFEAGSPAVNTYGSSTILVLLLVGSLVAVMGIGLGYAVWRRRVVIARAVEPAVLGNAWFFDRAISWFMATPGRAVFDSLEWLDRVVVDGAVNGVGYVLRESGGFGRKVQSGYVRRYALGLSVGAVVMLGFLVTRIVAT